MKENKITISVPNADTYLGNYLVCPREIIQKAYTEKIGTTMEFCGANMRVSDVRITEDYIFIDLISIPGEVLRLEKQLYNTISVEIKNEKERSL